MSEQRQPPRCPHCGKRYTEAMCNAKGPKEVVCTMAPGHDHDHIAEGQSGEIVERWPR